MAKKDPKDRFFDMAVSGKFGRPYEYGQKIYGQGYFGVKEIEWDKNELGFAIYGTTAFGTDDKRWGIYQRRQENGKIFYIKENFYQGWGTGSETQQATRDNFAAGMTAWKALTPTQKMWYRKKASRINLPAQNLFMRQYLNSL
jgi:hypothetical protein